MFCLLLLACHDRGELLNNPSPPLPHQPAPPQLDNNIKKSEYLE